MPPLANASVPSTLKRSKSNPNRMSLLEILVFMILWSFQRLSGRLAAGALAPLPAAVSCFSPLGNSNDPTPEQGFQQFFDSVMGISRASKHQVAPIQPREKHQRRRRSLAAPLATFFLDNSCYSTFPFFENRKQKFPGQTAFLLKVRMERILLRSGEGVLGGGPIAI